MNRFIRIFGTTAGTSLAMVTAAIAGSNYEAGPTVGDHGATAGIILLLAIGAVLLLKGNAPPPATEESPDAPAEEE